MKVRRLAPTVLALAASATVFAGIARGVPSESQVQDTQLDPACAAGAAAVAKLLANASSAQPRTIETELVVVAPGKLTGKIAFNPAGKSISVTADPSSGSLSGFGCAQGRSNPHGIGPGPSREVSKLSETFSKPGTDTLTFRLNQVGRRMLRRLAAADSAYAMQHPNGHRPPSLAFGVSLSYELSR